MAVVCEQGICVQVSMPQLLYNVFIIKKAVQKKMYTTLSGHDSIDLGIYSIQQALTTQGKFFFKWKFYLNILSIQLMI